jgi:molybdopterin-guanine dinucleotide biosynthesis protein A
MSLRPPVVGIFVGGQARRMGGVAKGNLVCEGRTILERTLEACASVPGGSRVYLVGNSAAYAVSGVERLEDEPSGKGPIGGLRALLVEAQRLGASAVALAGDMPFLTGALVARVLREQPHAAAYAPREGARWQPLFARYVPAQVLPAVDAVLARGDTALQSVLTELGKDAVVLALGESERAALIDWDRPNDMNPGCPISSQ